jgi:hypothetical protein
LPFAAKVVIRQRYFQIFFDLFKSGVISDEKIKLPSSFYIWLN